VEEAETTRAVRFLLIEGARRDIPDKNGRIPIDLVKTEDMRETYQTQLTTMLVSQFNFSPQANPLSVSCSSHL
jgi:hypothetical protein